MGFNNGFDDVKLSADGNTLVVVGRWDKKFHATEVHVAVHAVSDVTKRLEKQKVWPSVDGAQQVWEVALEQEQSTYDAPQRFEPGEKVFVVGQATSADEGLFLWADLFNLRA